MNLGEVDEVLGGSPKVRSAKALKRANKCVLIAEDELGSGASEEVIEDRALTLMSLSNAEIDGMLLDCPEALLKALEDLESGPPPRY